MIITQTPLRISFLVDKKEFLNWIGMIPDWNCETNITGQILKVAEMVKKYV